ncbi:MAG: SDR family oxidoreductase [Phenylobacterium sp.]
MADLTGKVVIITGASSGIGEAIARKLAGEGCLLMLAARRSDRLRALCEELGAGAMYAATDMADQVAVNAMVKATLTGFGKVDALINNAGIMPSSPLSAGRVGDWESTIDVNLKGVLYAINAVLPNMLERGGGQIVNFASVAALKIGPGGGVYAATKAAVRAISEALRLEMAGRLQVTVITPGAVATDLADSIPDEERRSTMKAAMAASGLAPSAVADAVAFVLGQPPGVSVNELIVRPTSATN